MPIERQEQALSLVLSDFAGGINTAASAYMLADNEAQLLENYEYDYNRLRTRGGLSAPIATCSEETDVESGFYDFETGCFFLFGKTPTLETDTAKIYKTDLTTTTYLGKLTGRERPVCCKYDSKVFIASGDHYQVYDYVAGLSTIENSFLTDNIFERFGRIATTKQGDDNQHYSSTGDATSAAAWTDNSNDDSTAKWLEVGYKDGGDIVTTKPLANDLMVFKTNGKIYQISGEYPSWVCMVAGANSDVQATKKSIETVGDNIVFMTQSGLKSLGTVSTYGNFSMNEIGYKFNRSLSATVYKPILWNIVRKRQLIIAPNYADRKVLYVYQYNMDSGMKLVFPQPVNDIFDTPDGAVMLIGNSLYRWGFDYATDNGTAITSKVKTKKFMSSKKFIVRSFDFSLESASEGNFNVAIGGKTFAYPLNSTKRIRHLYADLKEFDVTFECASPHVIDRILLYGIEV